MVKRPEASVIGCVAAAERSTMARLRCPAMPHMNSESLPGTTPGALQRRGSPCRTLRLLPLRRRLSGMDGPPRAKGDHTALAGRDIADDLERVELLVLVEGGEGGLVLGEHRDHVVPGEEGEIGADDLHAAPPSELPLHAFRPGARQPGAEVD